MFSRFNVMKYKRSTESSFLSICDKDSCGKKKSFSSHILKKENSMFSGFNVTE